MLRVLILIGVFLFFFLTTAPRKARRSPTTITPYINSLDGVLSAPQVSSALDETMPYPSWLTGRQAEVRDQAQADGPPLNSRADGDYVVAGGHGRTYAA
jgi:hypothetical protein